MLITCLKTHQNFSLLLGQRPKSLTRLGLPWPLSCLQDISCPFLSHLFSSQAFFRLLIPVMLLPLSFRSFVYTVLSSRLLSPPFYFLYFYISFRFQLKHHFHGEKNPLTISPSIPLHATLDWVRVPYTFWEPPMCFLLRTHQSQEIYVYVCYYLINF